MAVAEGSMFIEFESETGYNAVCIDHIASVVANASGDTGTIYFRSNGYMSLDSKAWPAFIAKWRQCMGSLPYSGVTIKCSN